MEHQTKTSRWQVAAMPLVLGAALLTSAEVQAADNLNFVGNLVVEACTIRPGDEALKLEFRDAYSHELYLNTRTPGRAFEIHLEGCDTSIADSITTTFSGIENAELPGLLKLDGGSSASGIAIGIETPANKPLPLNVASEKQALNDGSNVILLKAYIRGEPKAIADRLIVVGVFTATSTFTLDYQ